MGLSLKRKRGERVVIQMTDGREVVITVADAQGGAATLEIDAPRDVRVDRSEVYEARRLTLGTTRAAHAPGPDGKRRHII
jgi:sRNA-binding carbon storage regulator CsrA